MAKPKVAFLFDNDGVLVDTSELHWESWELLKKEEPELTLDRESFVRGFGKRNDLILQSVAPDVPIEKRKQWADRKEEIFRQIAAGKVKLLPGMEEFLEVLKVRGIPRIIASSTPVENLKMYLKETVLGQYFDEYISAEEVRHGKPAPDIFLAAADRLGYLSEDCIVIEDAPAGIQSGRKAGCFVIAMATTHPALQLTGYNLLVSSPLDLDYDMIMDEYTKWENRNPILRYTFGALLIIAGVVGLVFPIIPGWLLIFAGLYLIKRRWVSAKWRKLRGKFQKK